MSSQHSYHALANISMLVSPHRDPVAPTPTAHKFNLMLFSLQRYIPIGDHLWPCIATNSTPLTFYPTLLLKYYREYTRLTNLLLKLCLVPFTCYFLFPKSPQNPSPHFVINSIPALQCSFKAHYRLHSLSFTISFLFNFELIRIIFLCAGC